MARTFSIDTAVKPLSLLARAKKAAYENDAILVGDEHSGYFSHELVKGDYRMVGQTVLITITEKHWLVPWPVVESQLGALVQQRPMTCPGNVARGPRGGEGGSICYRLLLGASKLGQRRT